MLAPVIFLLPVWGEKYVQKFLNFGLPSLLAAGNIPQICKQYPCTFVFLSLQSDIDFIKSHPLYTKLAYYCTVKFLDISDLVFIEGYSAATLTLAYERGIRHSDDSICKSYFIFLVSDCILADTSLKNLIRYMQKGYQAITSGSFQVIEESICPHLEAYKKESALALPSREMLTLAFQHLHPLTQASTLTQKEMHLEHPNSLFWKINDSTMIGHFYLRHMLCIKPETDQYQLGSFCDYSFIPMMCPSGRVAHIQDSDEFCMLEMAPGTYGKERIKPGNYEQEKLAKQLNEWTTEMHRSQAFIPVVYHCDDKKPFLDAAIQSSTAFIHQLQKDLYPIPQPDYFHPYWISCVETLLSHLLLKKDKTIFYRNNIFAGLIGSPTFFPAQYHPKDDCPTFFKPHWIKNLFFRRICKRILKKHPSFVLIAYTPPKQIYLASTAFLYPDSLEERSLTELCLLFHQNKDVVIWLSDDQFLQNAMTLQKCALFVQQDNNCSIIINQTHKRLHKTVKNQIRNFKFNQL